MNKFLIKQKEIILPFCEGEAEMLIFNFLKISYSNRKIRFKGPKNLGGIRDLAEFKRKYSKHIRGLNFLSKKEFTNVRLLFLIDNDLVDSDEIADFIIKEGHLLQLLKPNTEAMILSIAGKALMRDVGHRDFRKKSKKEFFNHFACEAHQLKDTQLKELFNLKAVETNLAVLYKLLLK